MSEQTYQKYLTTNRKPIQVNYRVCEENKLELEKKNDAC